MQKEDLIFNNTEREKEKVRNLLDKIKKKLSEDYIKIKTSEIKKGNRTVYRKK